jgi:hypothetical protein
LVFATTESCRWEAIDLMLDSRACTRRTAPHRRYASRAAFSVTRWYRKKVVPRSDQ